MWKWLKRLWNGSFRVFTPKPTWQAHLRLSYNLLPLDFRDRWEFYSFESGFTYGYELEFRWKHVGHEPHKPVYKGNALLTSPITFKQAEGLFNDLLSKVASTENLRYIKVMEKEEWDAKHSLRAIHRHD